MSRMIYDRSTARAKYAYMLREQEGMTFQAIANRLGTGPKDSLETGRRLVYRGKRIFDWERTIQQRHLGFGGLRKANIRWL